MNQSAVREGQAHRVLKKLALQRCTAVQCSFPVLGLCSVVRSFLLHTGTLRTCALYDVCREGAIMRRRQATDEGRSLHTSHTGRSNRSRSGATRWSRYQAKSTWSRSICSRETFSNVGKEEVILLRAPTDLAVDPLEKRKEP